MRFLLLTAVALCFCTPLQAQWKEPPSTGSPQYRLPDRTNIAGQSGMGAVLTAKLIDERGNAKEHRAVVDVHTDGVQIVDAADVHKEPKLDEGHIQYRVDSGPPQNTTQLRFTIPNLGSGEHYIRVTLAANDNLPIGAETVLRVKIP